jgi:cytoplasmic iron level regulating protein YaaA (DUF328/UPF0246 family)
LLLAEASVDEVSRVLKVRGPLLERALAFSELIISGAAPTMPAWQRYSGVVWSHLDPANLSGAQRRRVLIPSGLYGLSSGTDEVADYRLTMKTTLVGLGNVTSFWRPNVTRALADLTNATFVDLLPKEHAAAIGVDEKLSSRTVRVSFLRHSGEGVAGHDAKAVKGVLARRILIDGVDAVEGFRWKGWRGRVHLGHFEVRAPRAS